MTDYEYDFDAYAKTIDDLGECADEAGTVNAVDLVLLLKAMLSDMKSMDRRLRNLEPQPSWRQ